MQHARRHRRPTRPLSLHTIRRIACTLENDVDRASLERFGMLLLDHSPDALRAAAWEAEALGERSDTQGLVATPAGEPICRCPR